MKERIYNEPTCPECHGKRVVTAEDHEDFRERQNDRRIAAMESGQHPGFMY